MSDNVARVHQSGCWKVAPVDFFPSYFPEVFIGLGEMLAAKETTMCRHRRWMNRLQHTVLLLKIENTKSLYTLL